jgi:hypothetical protein
MTNDFPPQAAQPNRVTVVDFEMPFTSMVVLMVKWTLAAIPALLLLGVGGLLIAALITVLGFAR